MLFVAATLSNCSSDDNNETPAPVLYPQQSPLQGYLAASGFNQLTTNSTNLSDTEIGFSFIPTVTGQINAITAKIPDNRTAMRITIWDKLVGTPVRTEFMDVANGLEATKIITPLLLVKNKEYVISCNTNDFYTHSRTNGSSVAYPITSGDISVTGAGYTNGSVQAIPSIYDTNYYTGDVSFVFQRTE